MTIRLRLILCLCFLALAMAAMGASSFEAIVSVSERTRAIVQDRVMPMDQLKSVSDMYAVNIVDAVHKIRSGHLKIEDGEKAIRSALEVIEEQWAAYQATQLTPDEKVLSDQFMAARDVSNVSVDKLLSILAARDMAALATFADKELYPAIDPLSGPIGDLMKLQLDVAQQEFDAAQGEKTMLVVLMILLAGAGAIVVGMSVWVVLRGVVAPLRYLQTAMLRLAEGILDTPIFGEGRKDEIGKMAAAVAIFRDNAVERVKLETDAETGRVLTEKERQAREALKAQEAEAVRFAVDSLASGLAHLADGALQYRLNEPFAEQLDRLRVDFNSSVSKLEHTLAHVGENARGIEAGAHEIRSAADDLSKRTEQQAASVEETAAALEQISTTLQDSSQRASEAGRLVGQTRIAAEKSGEVVRRAVEAMTEISRSSDEITSIISVIDGIAFQTNLLALNAGVEAARAGDAGKGFAVVAQEVRELAQRSAKAAKEINALINTSGMHVRSGVALVSETGGALETIIAEVKEINTHVSAIVQASREQAVGIQEINSAVNTLDHGTQQNAAMVEQSTAASHGLTREVAALNQLLSQFTFAADRGSPSGAYQRAA